jgi:JmjC domain, hydroxylase/jmjN domain/HB1, ASXL, restriction endonuclease HTH domain
MSIAFDVPTFHPSIEEFGNFSAYMEEIRPDLERIGLAKICPPREWLECKRYFVDMKSLDAGHVDAPIEQQIYSTGATIGCYEVTNFEGNRVAVPKFRERAVKGAPELSPHLFAHLSPRVLQGVATIAECVQEQEQQQLIERENEKEKAKGDDEALLDERNKLFEAIDRRFWKSLLYAPAMYGADALGSLFRYERDDNSDDDNAWNLNRLDSLLRVLGKGISGVTSSNLYFGSFKALFAIHIEDMNLFSINFVHTGAPKRWYAVADAQQALVERLAACWLPEQRSRCSEFMRHKTTLLNPTLLAANGVRVHTTVQLPGEFIVTHPGAYHQGYNLGYNVAEAVNFALPCWLEHGRRAKHCRCTGHRRDSVRIDMGAFDWCIKMVAEETKTLLPNGMPDTSKIAHPVLDLSPPVDEIADDESSSSSSSSSGANGRKRARLESAMTFLDAAELLLKANGNAAQSARQLTAQALSAGHVATSGRTPVNTMAAQLATDVKRAEPKFERIAPGMYRLLVVEQVNDKREEEEEENHDEALKKQRVQ